MANSESASYRFSLRCMAQLAASGVGAVVASPGFRNSPLLLAAHRTPGLEVITAIDERGAGFFALGLARAQRKPVAILCTSGTAAGNFMPAVMEASHSQIPLVVITADRPQELVGTGANQCTDQAKIFGSLVRLFFDTAPPSGADHEKDHAGYLVGKAVSRSTRPNPGPVHLNIRFREPFLPGAEETAKLESEPSPRPWSFFGSASGPGEEQALAINAMIRVARRPIFVLGPGHYGQRLLGRLCELSAKSNIPVAAEGASGIAYCENTSRPGIIHRVETLFSAMAEGKLEAPDLFFRIGAPPTGKAYSRLLSQSALPQVVLEDWGETREPGLYPSIMVEGDIESWLSTDAAWLGANTDRIWTESLISFDEKVEARIDEHLKKIERFTEWHFHRHFEKQIGRSSNLFLGNSMPIRDFNSVFPKTAKRMRIFCNRGLSGIDGLIASAAGVAFGTRRETHAILGDLSTIHDLSSLSLISELREKINLTLWVINNGGGEIFRMVPTAHSGAPQEWFTTPQSIDLSGIAKGFRLSYSRVHSLSTLETLVPETFSEEGIRLIEVLIDSTDNTRARKTFRYE